MFTYLLTNYNSILLAHSHSNEPSFAPAIRIFGVNTNDLGFALFAALLIFRLHVQHFQSHQITPINPRFNVCGQISVLPILEFEISRKHLKRPRVRRRAVAENVPIVLLFLYTELANCSIKVDLRLLKVSKQQTR